MTWRKSPGNGTKGKREVSSMLMIIQAEATKPQIQIAQETVIAIIAASTTVVLGLLCLMGYFAKKAPEKEGPLHYGNFFVVIFGILTVLIGFLIAFPLVISNVFSDPTQVIALLSALFGTIVGLVGTYFGVKSSSDATQNAQNLAKEATQRNFGRTNGPPGATPNGAATVPASGTPTEGAPWTAGSTTDPGKTGAHGDKTAHESPSQEKSERNR
jgi:hypothetical protein